MQWLTIPCAAFSIITVGVYMNAQLAFMLPDKDMFNIPQEKIGKITSELIYIATPFSMITSVFASYAYELFGRKKTIFVSYFLTGFVYVWFPNTAPSYPWLVVCRVAIAITFAPPCLNPLVNDYVSKSTRGKAVAMNGVGMVIGELFAMGILLKFTMNMSYYNAFLVAACFIWFFAFFFLFTVKDPDLE